MQPVTTLRNGRRAIFRRFSGVVVLLLLLAISEGFSQEPDKAETVAVEWTAADTKLANHYLQLLQTKPEYGNVLNLLWDLYGKKGQTPLLMDYVGEAARQKDAEPVTLLIYGHLLRKNDELDQAGDFYSKVLEAEPKSQRALIGSAEVADQQLRDEDALGFYQEAMKLVAAESDEGVKIRMRAAELLRSADQKKEAIQIWNELLVAHRNDSELRSTIVAFLLQEGQTKSAITVLRELAEAADADGDIVGKLGALVELNRLYEFIDDFDGALESLRRGLELVHFKNHQHDELFTKLVRLFERYGRLDELEGQLEEEARQERPSERSVLELANFYHLTAESAHEREWVERLCLLVPSDIEYQIRHATICMETDRFEDAAGILDQLLQENPQAPLRYILLRCRVALNASGRQSAEKILSQYVAETQMDSDSQSKILGFAREFYLDGIVEEILKKGGSDPVQGAASIKLARFLNERGRRSQAVTTLDSYVEAAGEVKVDRARRLHEVSLGFREMGLLEEAIAAINEAVSIISDQKTYHLTKAEIFMDLKNLEGAIAAFETVRQLTEGLEEKSRLDQRMFSLLRGIIEEPTEAEKELQRLGSPSGVIDSIEQYRRLAVAASQGRRDVEAPPPQQLTDFYNDIISAASDQPTLETRYRAAWWAFKMQDTQTCFEQLSKAKAESGKPNTEVEKLLLEMAVQMDRPTFQARHLKTLSEIDPENRDQYLHRWAEVRFVLGFEDEAIRMLQELAAKPEASLGTLKTLADAYGKLGSAQRQIDVWKNAYQRANLFEKRKIIKQLTTVLVAQRQPDEALEAQLDLIGRDNDPVQKRKLFDSQLSLARRHFMLPWLQKRYEELTRAHPFDGFFPKALAQIYQAGGADDKALETMKKAYYLSGQDRDVLVKLGELAAESNDLKAAIYYRRQLIAQSEEDTDIESWNSLILMLEKDLRSTESDMTRRRLESRFGQDAEFLSDLAGYYRDSGQLNSEIRVLSKIYDLRPWDQANALAMGIAKEKRGDLTGAIEAFESIISKATDVIRQPLRKQKYGEFSMLPVTRSGTGGIESMTLMIERFPFLKNDLQEELINWLEEKHPEFEFIPSQPEWIQLRAIEATARIVSKGSPQQKAEWISRWKNGKGATPTEKLWAFHYAGAGPETCEFLMQGLGDNPSALECVWLSYLSILAGENEGFLDWVKEDSSRKIYPIIGLLLAVADRNGNETLPESNDELFASLDVSDNIGDLFFKVLRERRDPGSAYRIGKILADGSLRKSGDFYYSLSEVAGQLGYQHDRIHLLNRALDLMQEEAIHRMPTYYTSTVSELYALSESAKERQDLIAKINSWVEEDSAADTGVRLQTKVYLESLIGRTDQAVRAFQPLADYTMEQSLPTGNIDDDEKAERNRWTRMMLNFRFAAARLDLSARQAHDFDEILASVGAIPALTDEGSSGIEEFEAERVAFFLENVDSSQGSSAVWKSANRMEDQMGRMLLARTLDARGFRREAMSVYHKDAMRFTEDYSILRGFLDAAVAVGEPKSALELIEHFFAQNDAIPTGMVVGDLRRYHAEFLYQLRDVERLNQLSHMEFSGNDLSKSETVPFTAYQDFLARTYLKIGETESLLRLLKHMRSQKTAGKAHLLTGADLLSKRGDGAVALDWLSEIKIDQSMPEIESEALILKAKLSNDEKVLARAMRETAEFSKPELSIAVAHELLKAGMTGSAISGLLLQARQSVNGDFTTRSKLLGAALEIKLKSGEYRFEDLEPELIQFMDTLSEGAATEPELIELVTNHGKAEWLPLLEPYLTQEKTRVVAFVAMGYLQSEFFDADFAGQLSPEQFSSLLAALVRFGPDGKTAARAFIDSHPDFRVRSSLGGDARRQIRFFAAIDDRMRLSEVHSRLMEEVGSDRFNQRGQFPQIPAFGSRWALAREFADAGFSELAESLYRRYHESIRRLNPAHAPFIEDYVRFVLEKGEFARAEEILRPGFQKDIQLSTAVLAELFHQKSDPIETTRIAQLFSLSQGQTIELEEFRRELAENGKLSESPLRL